MPTTIVPVPTRLEKCRRHRLPNELLSELVDWLPMAQFVDGDTTMAPSPPRFGAFQMWRAQARGLMRNVALIVYLDRARHKFEKVANSRIMSDLQRIYDKCTPEQRERIKAAGDAAAEKARRAAEREMAAELGVDLDDSAEHEEVVTGVAGQEDQTIPVEGQDEHQVALERDEGMLNRGNTRKRKHDEAEQPREEHEPSPALKRTKLDAQADVQPCTSVQAQQKHLLQQPQGAVEVRHQLADGGSEDTLRQQQRVAVEVCGQPEEGREEEALPLSQDPPPMLTPQQGENVLTGPDEAAILSTLRQFRVKIGKLRSQRHGHRITNLNLSKMIEFFYIEKTLFDENVLNNADLKRALGQCLTDLDPQNVLLSWLILEIALCTQTRGGVETNRIHVPCRGCIEVQVEKLRDFYRAEHPQEATTLANDALAICRFFLDVFCHTLNNERFTEEEMVAIFAIFLFNLKPGTEQQNQDQHSQNMSQCPVQNVPSSSSRHGTALLFLPRRLGNIYLLQTSLFHLVTLLKEHNTMLDLSR